jgi:hypothetical protein
MRELERRITGDWYDLREAGKDQYALIEFLGFSSQDLGRLAEELRSAVEEGLIEYKDMILRRAFITLEAVQFQSVRFEELQAREQPLKDLVFVVLLQRLLCTGVIPLPKSKEGEGLSPDDLDVSSVITEVRNRIKRDPSFQTHPAVKNIFVQVALYQKEKKKMEELLPMIQPEKMDVFRANFGATFKRIFDSIKKNYSDILIEEESRRLDRENKRDLLHRVPLKDLAPFLQNQAQSVCRICSTLTYAREDKYKTRGILVDLYKQKEEYFKRIESEQRVYRSLCAEIGLIGTSDCPIRVNYRLRDELIHVLERMSKVEEKP